MADCCSKITAEMDRLRTHDFWPNQNLLPALRQTMDMPPGSTVTLPSNQKVPSLDDLLSRIATPLGGPQAGWGDWEWYNASQPGKTALTLPQAPTPALTEVSLNGVVLVSPRDYGIAGATLTFVHGLDVGDHVHVKTYGA